VLQIFAASNSAPLSDPMRFEETIDNVQLPNDGRVHVFIGESAWERTAPLSSANEGMANLELFTGGSRTDAARLTSWPRRAD
jgi:hypothetical protein